MISRSTLRWTPGRWTLGRWTLGLAILSAAGACMAPKPGLGPDQGTRSNATLVTWSDGKPAYAIKCDLPGGCQSRALFLCNNGAYTTLASQNMPTVGNVRAVEKPPYVVVRCG